MANIFEKQAYFQLEFANTSQDKAKDYNYFFNQFPYPDLVSKKMMFTF